jgi:hypothetical protein
MNVSQASKIWLDYHKTHSKKATVRAYEWGKAGWKINFSSGEKLSCQN